MESSVTCSIVSLEDKVLDLVTSLLTLSLVISLYILDFHEILQDYPKYIVKVLLS